MAQPGMYSDFSVGHRQERKGQEKGRSLGRLLPQSEPEVIWAKAEMEALEIFAGQRRGRNPRDDNLAQEELTLSSAPRVGSQPAPFVLSRSNRQPWVKVTSHYHIAKKKKPKALHLKTGVLLVIMHITFTLMDLASGVLEPSPPTYQTGS